MVPFKIVSDSPTLHSRWLLFFKVMIISLWNLLQYHSVVRWVIQAQWAEPLVLYRIRVAHLYSFLCFVLSSSCVLCAQCCQCLWSLNSWLPLWFSLTFIYTARFVQQAIFDFFSRLLIMTLWWYLLAFFFSFRMILCTLEQIIWLDKLK
jgi:hypothetical protein